MAMSSKNVPPYRPDRLFGTNVNGHSTPDVGPEFCEEDVWSTATKNCPSWSPEPVQSRRTRHHTRQDLLGRSSGLSLAFDDVVGHWNDDKDVHRSRIERHVVASAPVDMPDWPTMVSIDSGDHSIKGSVDETERVPPHEYLAREYAKSVTTSVFQGVGRTLKGRDMTRVRDAVWRQTGFFG